MSSGCLGPTCDPAVTERLRKQERLHCEAKKLPAYLKRLRILNSSISGVAIDVSRFKDKLLHHRLMLQEVNAWCFACCRTGR